MKQFSKSTAIIGAIVAQNEETEYPLFNKQRCSQLCFYFKENVFFLEEHK